MFETLDESNFVLYAAKYYQNPNCSGEDEFLEDLKRIKYLKRLFVKYESTNELKERLAINHLTVLYNVFYSDACTRMLVYKLREYLQYLKPFLITMSYWKERIGPIGLDKEIIVSTDIPMDEFIIHKLRRL